MSEKSIWVNFLDRHITEDKYTVFREKCSFLLESTISSITQELLNQNPNYSIDTARKVGINLLMEQMLTLQHEYAPQSQKAMVMALFEHLPSLSEFRQELIESCVIPHKAMNGGVGVTQREYIDTEKQMTGFQKVIQFFKNNF